MQSLGSASSAAAGGPATTAPAGPARASTASKPRAASGIGKELMARMGHSSVRAALIYQHASRSRDKQIADAISHNVQEARRMGHAGDEDGLTRTAQTAGPSR